MTVVQFPAQLPPLERIELAKAHLCNVLQSIADRSMARASEVISSRNASTLAAVVAAIASDAEADSAGWAQLVSFIRKAWGIGP